MFSNYIMLLTMPYMVGISVILLIIGGGVGALIIFKFFRKSDIDISDYDKKIAKTSLSNYCTYMGDKFPVLLESRRHLLFLNEDGYQMHSRLSLKDHKKEMVDRYIEPRKKRNNKTLAV